MTHTHIVTNKRTHNYYYTATLKNLKYLGAHQAKHESDCWHCKKIDQKWPQYIKRHTVPGMKNST